jgi:hypothetical protein
VRVVKSTIGLLEELDLTPEEKEKEENEPSEDSD